jgi:basic membrane protein A
MLNANEEKMIGFLDGIGSSVINDFLVGFIERTLYEDPEIKVALSYIGDLFDAAKG